MAYVIQNESSPESITPGNGNRLRFVIVSCMSVIRETRRVGMAQWWKRSPHHWVRFRLGVICGLSLLLVLVLLRGFFSVTPVLLPQNWTNISKFQFDHDRGHTSENQLSLIWLRLKILYWVSCEFLLDLVMFPRVLWDAILPGRSGISGFWDSPYLYRERGEGTEIRDFQGYPIQLHLPSLMLSFPISSLTGDWM